MKNYFVKIDDRERGPLTESEVAQLFADGRANRDTPCKLAPGGAWKTIDDYLPMLKYGTQLPAPSVSVVRSEEPSAYGAPAQRSSHDGGYVPGTQKVTVVDIDLSFVSILKLLFKWTAAGVVVGCCLIPVVIILVVVMTAFFGSLFGQLLPPFPRP